MGKLFDQFGSLTFRNEAEVSQNFITPLLEGYLGYRLDEIIPERYYSTKDIYSGVKFSEGGSKSHNHRPDFVICINGDVQEPRFIIDSKGPDEGIDDHLGQLKSYAISVGRNLLMMTNGRELKVYDVNNLLFHATDIDDLQVKIGLLTELLGRNSHLLKSPLEIIRDFNFEKAISVVDQNLIDTEIRRRTILLADFNNYLKNIQQVFANWHLPSNHFQALGNLDLKKIDPSALLRFRIHSNEKSINKQKFLMLPEIETDHNLAIKTFVGETGTGKSCLLKYWVHRAAQTCLDYRESVIPIFISLREIGHGYKLEDLIVAALNRNGYVCTSIYDLPQNNDFVLFLDAYDEIGEQFLRETSQSIENFGKKFECYLSTRPNRIPAFKPSLVLDVLPISDAQIKTIVRHHIHNNYYEFLRQIEHNGLKAESGNILLLLCLVSVFKESAELPDTVTQLMHSIVKRVRDWQDSKSQSGPSIKWGVLQKCLGVLAYQMVESRQISLKREQAEELLPAVLLDLEKSRQITLGITTTEIIEQLAETGLLLYNNDSLYFWHRLFLNYFGAFQLKEKFIQDAAIIEAILHLDSWGILIVGMAGFLPSVTTLIESLKGALWLAAFCLAENKLCKDEVIKGVIDQLIAQLGSAVPDVRLKAINCLANIDHEYVRQFFFNAIESDYSPDVRMSAFKIIGRTRSPEALVLINTHLNWVESAYPFGPDSQSAIVRGLYYYGEKEHLQIIRIWATAPNFILARECKNIFIELNGQQKLTPKIITSLQNLFTGEYQAKQTARDRNGALANILALVLDDQFATEVLALPFKNNQIEKMEAIYELFKDYPSLPVILQIKDLIFSAADEHYVVEKLMEIITDSSCTIPKEVFLELIAHPNSNIAAKAIGGLKRFPYKEVRAEVEKHLFGDQPQLQGWALGVLVDNAEIIYLIREQRFPARFYLAAAHTLLKAVRRFHLAEALPVMERIFDALANRSRYEYEVRLSTDLAGTYYFMGEKEKEAAIIAWFFDGHAFLQESDNIHFHIMKSIKYLDPELAFQLTDCYYKTYLPYRDNDIRFKMEVFLEAVDDLGQQAFVPMIKELTQVLIDAMTNGDKKGGYHLERPLRSLVSLASAADEDWILAQLNSLLFDPGMFLPQLRRAIECLAVAGGLKSIRAIKLIAQQYESNAMVLNTCQVAFEQINRRLGMSITGGDLLQE